MKDGDTSCAGSSGVRLRYGRRLDLGIEGPFLADLAEPVFRLIRRNSSSRSERQPAEDGRPRRSRVEEEGFRRTMSVGADRVGEAISEARREGETTLPGAAAFRLYDTHGVPLELIEEIASDEGVQVDRRGLRPRARRSPRAEQGRLEVRAGERPADRRPDRSLVDDRIPRVSRAGFRAPRGREGARPAFNEAGEKGRFS